MKLKLQQEQLESKWQSHLYAKFDDKKIFLKLNQNT